MDVSKEFKSIESLNDHVAKEYNNRVQGIRGHKTEPGCIRLQKHTRTFDFTKVQQGTKEHQGEMTLKGAALSDITHTYEGSSRE